jgi:hypothetical protein
VIGRPERKVPNGFDVESLLDRERGITEPAQNPDRLLRCRGILLKDQEPRCDFENTRCREIENRMDVNGCQR